MQSIIWKWESKRHSSLILFRDLESCDIILLRFQCQIELIYHSCSIFNLRLINLMAFLNWYFEWLEKDRALTKLTKVNILDEGRSQTCFRTERQLVYYIEIKRWDYHWCPSLWYVSFNVDFISLYLRLLIPRIVHYKLILILLKSDKGR